MNNSNSRDIYNNPSPMAKDFKVIDTADNNFNSKFNQKLFDKLGV